MLISRDHIHMHSSSSLMGFPRQHSCKESSCHCRRHKRDGFDPWVGKILWRRKWQSTPVFLSGKSRGQRSQMGYSLWVCKESDMTKQLSTRLSDTQMPTMVLEEGMMELEQVKCLEDLTYPKDRITFKPNTLWALNVWALYNMSYTNCSPDLLKRALFHAKRKDHSCIYLYNFLEMVM